MKNYYYAAFIPADEGGYNIIVPDVPGVISCADTEAEAFEMAQDALAVVLRDLVKNKKPIPAPSGRREVEMLTARHLDEIGETASYIEIGFQLIPAPVLDTAPVKVTISLPQSVLDELDGKATASGLTRSGFIARAVANTNA